MLAHTKDCAKDIFCRYLFICACHVFLMMVLTIQFIFVLWTKKYEVSLSLFLYKNEIDTAEITQNNLGLW